MKVIFDSEQQKNAFLEQMAGDLTLCPRYLNLKEVDCSKDDLDCNTCWEQALELEVAEEEKNED